ncbi:Sec-independent protein translocase protein TatB [Sphingosinithalassobacter portus]|uniref:Sec-independent protein translocase protein TatB n=1 Tax=Stakelama portus TaxID=2676234 RepID=UPI000D6E0321|nr:Sec-independent protein translocase protein TatB [Sphingosinithalassobacter portus]
MFADIGWSELLMVGFVALIVIGPKDLPKAMRFAGQWVGKARGMARQFRSGFDAMVREAELAEMEKKWAEENARIMREHPMAGLLPDSSPSPTVPATPAAPAESHTGTPENLLPDGEDQPPVMTEKPVLRDAPAESGDAAPASPPAAPEASDTATDKPAS